MKKYFQIRKIKDIHLFFENLKKKFQIANLLATVSKRVNVFLTKSGARNYCYYFFKLQMDSKEPSFQNEFFELYSALVERVVRC